MKIVMGKKEREMVKSRISLILRLSEVTRSVGTSEQARISRNRISRKQSPSPGVGPNSVTAFDEGKRKFRAFGGLRGADCISKPFKQVGRMEGLFEGATSQNSPAKLIKKLWLLEKNKTKTKTKTKTKRTITTITTTTTTKNPACSAG